MSSPTVRWFEDLVKALTGCFTTVASTTFACQHNSRASSQLQTGWGSAKGTRARFSGVPKRVNIAALNLKNRREMASL